MKLSWKEWVVWFLSMLLLVATHGINPIITVIIWLVYVLIGVYYAHNNYWATRRTEEWAKSQGDRLRKKDIIYLEGMTDATGSDAGLQYAFLLLGLLSLNTALDIINMAPGWTSLIFRAIMVTAVLITAHKTYYKYHTRVLITPMNGDNEGGKLHIVSRDDEGGKPESASGI